MTILTVHNYNNIKNSATMRSTKKTGAAKARSTGENKRTFKQQNNMRDTEHQLAHK